VTVVYAHDLTALCLSIAAVIGAVAGLGYVLGQWVVLWVFWQAAAGG
jgi:hypothetical protein